MEQVRYELAYRLDSQALPTQSRLVIFMIGLATPDCHLEGPPVEIGENIDSLHYVTIVKVMLKGGHLRLVFCSWEG